MTCMTCLDHLWIWFVPKREKRNISKLVKATSSLKWLTVYVPLNIFILFQIHLWWWYFKISWKAFFPQPVLGHPHVCKLLTMQLDCDENEPSHVCHHKYTYITVIIQGRSPFSSHVLLKTKHTQENRHFTEDNWSEHYRYWPNYSQLNYCEHFSARNKKRKSRAW